MGFGDSLWLLPFPWAPGGTITVHSDEVVLPKEQKHTCPFQEVG